MNSHEVARSKQHSGRSVPVQQRAYSQRLKRKPMPGSVK